MADSPELALLRAMLAGDDPPVERRAGRMVYHRPTLSHVGTDPGGQMIAARADHRVVFAFTEPGGVTVTYAGVITQDDLFRALHAAGLLHREVR